MLKNLFIYFLLCIEYGKKATHLTKGTKNEKTSINHYNHLFTAGVDSNPGKFCLLRH